MLLTTFMANVEIYFVTSRISLTTYVACPLATYVASFQVLGTLNHLLSKFAT